MAQQQKSRANRSVLKSSFGESLSLALEHFQDPTFLGNESPLASPYLLGGYLSGDASDPRTRGRALQAVLREALTQMDYDDADLHRTIIQERFFSGRSTVAVRALAQVSLGKTQYFTHQKRALAHFESYVLEKLNPAIRLERPLANIPELLDRNASIERCLTSLQKNETVMIVGASGTGKTSIGSKMAESWGKNVLWFTIRPGLNDHFSTFLFDLAYFFHQQNSPWLWQELIASNGQPNLDQLSGVIRHTVEYLSTKPLLCIDEADLLITSSDGNHAQFVQLFALLRGDVPILAMGQNSAIEAEQYEELGEFSPTVVKILLKNSGVRLEEDEIYRLAEYTGGNPRLLHLSITLIQSGEPLEGLLENLHRMPTIPFLLGRIFQRLNETEVGLLMELAIFQTPAPADAWQHESKWDYSLSSLQQKHLIQNDTQGALFLLPAYRDAILIEIPDAKRFELHARAAYLFQQRGKYTLAALHFSKTDSPEVAVWVWQSVQQQEINRGQAYAALQLFRTLDSMPLSTAAKEQVKITCATLENLVGSSAKAQADLRSVLWRTPLLQIEAEELGGVIANNQSEFDEAERLFKQAMANAEQLLEVRLAQMHKGLGWRYRTERNLEQAWHSVSLAQYEVENLQGAIQFARCEYQDAIRRFEKALELAHHFKHNDGIAKTCNNLARIYTMTGQYEEAMDYYKQAETVYQQIGKINAINGIKINRAFAHNLAGQYEQAAVLIHQLQKEQEHRGREISSLMAAFIDQNLAEAFLGLGKLERAEEYAQQAIAREEIIVLPDSLRTHGEIKLQQNHYKEAEYLIRSSINLIEQNDDPDTYLLGYGYRALAQVLIAEGETKLATEARTNAIELFSEISLQNEVNKTITIKMVS